MQCSLVRIYSAHSCPVQGFYFRDTFSRVDSPCFLHLNLFDLSTSLGFDRQLHYKVKLPSSPHGMKRALILRLNEHEHVFHIWCPDLVPISCYPLYLRSPPFIQWSLDSPIRHHAWKDCIRLHCFNSLWFPRVSWCWSAYLSICVKPGSGKKNANSARRKWVCPYLNIIRLAVARGPSLFCCWQPRCCVFS